jgi:farnesyl-diphosphate farnesyltransferase
VLGSLSAATPPAEIELLRHARDVLAVTATFSQAQRAALARCLRIMCSGMREYQQRADRRGLRDLPDLDRYCYFVAGVVGEMLTELFCAHSPALAARRESMMRLALSFGQGLQMTNILKDIWEDYARGACWLPAAAFARHGFDLANLGAPRDARAQQAFGAGLRELVGVAHAHLRSALAYTLMIPPEEEGIRRFCAWAIGLAALTLDRIAATPAFSAGAQVKISRRAVGCTVFLTRIGIGHDGWLRWLFGRAARRLPLAALDAGWDGFVPHYAPHGVRTDSLRLVLSE